MKKIKKILKELVSTFIVMFGVLLLNFYITNPIGVVSLIIGIVGYLILRPAIKEWEKTIWGSDNN